MSGDAAEMDNRLGNWSWAAGAGQLTLSLETDVLKPISGVWTLDGLSAELDGLSVSKLRTCLATGDGPLSCQIVLAGGRRLRLDGDFDAEGNASGGVFQPIGDQQIDKDGLTRLQPLYQPIFSLGAGRMIGCEALARFDGHDANSADPLPSGLASAMLEDACASLEAWRAAGAGADFFVQVNLTGEDIRDSATAAALRDLLARYRIAPGQLRVELTEQAALQDADAVLAGARAITELGVPLILDDFGTGHSSFAWLASLPVSGLKLDGGLVVRLGEEKVRTIARAILSLAGELGLTTTAEGIETSELHKAVRSLGFDQGQGFALARPMSREALEARLRS